MTYELRYTSFDRLENHISEARCRSSVSFEAADDERAVEEAEALWGKLRATPTRGWDGADYPCEPELVRVVPFPPPCDCVGWHYHPCATNNALFPAPLPPPCDCVGWHYHPCATDNALFPAPLEPKP